MRDRVPADPALAPLWAELQRIAEMATQERPLLLTHEQAAAFVGVSRSAWFRLCSDGAVRAVSVPGVGPRFRRADLEKYVEKLKTGRRKVKAETAP